MKSRDNAWDDGTGFQHSEEVEDFDEGGKSSSLKITFRKVI